MKKNSLLLIFLLFATQCIWAQTTETFETETSNSTSFTDNGQVFNITTQLQGSFDIQSGYPGTGWNGTAIDNRYIDNDSYARFNTPVQFTVSSANSTPFKLKSMWLFLSTNNLVLATNGQTVTIEGKRAGVTQFTVTKNSGFSPSMNAAGQNGFTLFDMSVVGGQDNSNVIIDQYVISTSAGINYVCLDAMRWECVAPVLTQSQTNVTCAGANNGTATVNSAAGGITYNWAPGNPAGDGTATATGLTPGVWTCTLTNACGSTTTATFTITEPAALTGNVTQSNALCAGGTGSASISASGGTGAYSYLWSTGATGPSVSGLTAGNYTVTIKDANDCNIIKNFTITQPGILSAPWVITNIACYGGNTGSISVHPSGGVAPYTYLWSTGATTSSIANLTAGTYSVTVKDANNCSISITPTVYQQPALSASTTSTNVLCNGGNTGSATVSVTGGTAGYTYSWSPYGGNGATANALAAGNYTVTITDANGCTFTKAVSIAQPDSLTLTGTQSTITCAGSAGNATVNPGGGTMPYTYLWSNGATGATASGLIAGNHTVTVTDAAGCTATKSFTITSSPLSVTASSTNVVCYQSNTGSALASATGGVAPYSYSWSNGASSQYAANLTAGTYNVTVTDANSCSVTTSVVISQADALVTQVTQVTPSCNGGSIGTASVSATGGTAPYSYSWSGNGGSAATATGLAGGNYTVTVTDANGCTATQNVTVTESPSIIASVSINNILCNGGTASASVTATGGTGNYTYSWSNGSTQASAEGLTPGQHSVFVYDANMCYTITYFDIYEPAVLYAEVDTHQDVTCAGAATGMADVSIWGGQPPYSFEWFPYGGTNMTAYNLAAGDFSVTVTDANGCSYVAEITISEPASAVSAQVTTQNITCGEWNNGSASVVATGGAGNYTYYWSNGETGTTVTGLTESEYYVTVTDGAGCTVTESFSITSPDQLMVTWEQTNATCSADGSITINVTGGSGSYTYQWSDGQTGSTITAPMGGYIVTITDTNGCSTMREFYIQNPDGMNVSVEASYITCQNPTATATVYVNGGQEPYTYLWSNGNTTAMSTGLTVGSHSVTVTNTAGCATTRQFEVYGVQPMVVDGTVTNIICGGSATGAIEINVYNSEGPFTYSWSNGSTDSSLTQLTAGTYTVTVSNNQGCSVTETYTITAPAPFTAQVAVTNITCAGTNTGAAAITVTGGVAPFTYVWSNGIDVSTANALQAGSYSVVVYDSNGCSSEVNFEITAPAAMLTAQISYLNNTCYTSNDAYAEAMASGGTAPYTYSWSNGSTSDLITDLAPGNYTVTVTDANGCIFTVSVIISQPAAIANDNCSGAQQIFQGTTAASNICALPSVTSATCINGQTAYDSWYSFASGAVTAFNVNADMGYVVYQGSCGTLTEVACNTQGGLTALQTIPFTTYYIRAYTTDASSRRDFSISLEVPCNLPANVAAVASGLTSATVSWNAATPVPAEGYQYEIRTSGTAGSGTSGLVASGNTQALSQIVNGLNTAVIYSAYVRSSCGDSHYSSWTAAVDFFTGYCIPAPSSGNGAGITNVTFGSVNNTTVSESGNYADNTALTGSVLKSDPVTISVSTDAPSRTKVWVDWNNDFDFDDTDELVAFNSSPETLFAGSFTIPAATSVGNYRMRVGTAAPFTFDPCYTGANGSFEDYTLNVFTYGPAHLTAEFCNATVTGFRQHIFANNVTGATAYRFRVATSSGTQVIETASPYFSLDMLSSFAYGVTYNVDVAVNVGGTWSDYGSSCKVFTQAVTPATQLQNCGATVNNFTTAIYANLVQLATTYRFEISSTAGTTVLDRPNAYFMLNMVQGYAYGVTYTVRVNVLANGVWSGYGESCTVTTIGQLPVTQLRTVDCGATVATFATDIYANVVPLAQTYHFTVSSVYGIVTLDRPSAFFRLNMLPQYDYNTTYTVSVTASAPGAATSAAGASCTVTSPAVMPVTTLRSADCGATIASRAVVLYPNLVAGAVTYRFRMVSAAGTFTINRPTGNFKLNMFPVSAINPGETVAISVQTVSANGTTSAYGNACNVTLSNLSARPGAGEVAQNDGISKTEVKGYPNPFVQTFSVELTTESNERVNVMVYDMTGKLVEQRDVDYAELPGLKLGANLASGVYNMILTQGETIKTLRIVKHNN